MNKEKKEELAEMDSRWNFEKTLQVPTLNGELGWEQVKDTFNKLQSDQGDLYMEVSKMPQPKRTDQLKLWYRQRKTSGEKVTIHHSQIYHWFRGLAQYLDISVGKAISRVIHDREELRKDLDLGDTVTVEMNSISQMDTREESEVSKDELEDMIQDD